MKIQIVDKNNNAWFDCDENVIYQQHQDETLDSANLRISHLPSEIEIEPFDRVIMWDETERFFDNYFYLAVDTYERTEEGLDNPTYAYDISLFSETKLLETEILPNLIITQQISPFKSIYNYLDIYLKLYGKKVRIGGNWVNAWTLDSSMKFLTKFSATCPEMQWNTPTLREVFTDLMMVVDCIPTMRNGVISFIDLQEVGSEIDYYNYVKKSQSSADYLSNIRMQMTNVLQTKIDGVKNSVNRTEYIHFTSPTMLVNSENTILETMYPILNIKHLYLCLTGEASPVDTDPNYWFMKIDLCNYASRQYPTDIQSLIKERKEYDALETLYRGYQITNIGGDAITNQTASDVAKYQNYCVYYNRFGKTIEGWSRITKQYINYQFGAEKTTLQALQVMTIDASSSTYRMPTSFIETFASYFKCFFEIEYETTMDALCSTTKQDYPNNSRTIMDNQTNSFVDAFSQGRLEVNKANRLGNVMYMINQRIEEDNNLAKLLKIKDTYKGAIVYQAQYQIYTDHAEVNAYACLNYILRDYWTGIKSRPRTYNNAMDEALERHDLYKKFAEFSFSSCSEYLKDGEFYPTQTKDLAWWCVSPFRDGIDVSPIKYAFVHTECGDGSIRFPSDVNYEFALDCISRVIGNSVVFTFGFTDNTIVGKWADVTTNGAGTLDDRTIVDKDAGYGGVPLQYSRYIDDRYEFQDIYFKLINNINFLGNDGTMPDNDGERIDYAVISNVWNRLYKIPEIKNDVATNYDVDIDGCILDYKKDNRETPTISCQIEYCCDNRDMYFTIDLVRNHQGVRTTDTSLLDTLVYTGTYVYGKDTLTDLTLTGAIVTPSGINVYSARIEIDGIDSYKGGVYLVKNGKILMGLNFKETGSKIFYLNILKDRDKNVYTTNSEGTKVRSGTIKQ